MAMKWREVCCRELVSFSEVGLTSCKPALPAQHLSIGYGKYPVGGSFSLTTWKNTFGYAEEDFRHLQS